MGDEGEEGLPDKEYEYVGDRNPETRVRQTDANPATATFPNGDVFVGHYKEGKRNGKGEYSWKEKDVEKGKYVGDYKDHKRQTATGGEPGIYIDASTGGKYTGEWFENKRHGKGVYTYPNNDVYSGEWINGMKQGRGTYIYAANGCQLIGDWMEGKFVAGECAYPNGTRYRGKFDGSKPTGAGRYVFANGNMQDGEYTEKMVGDEGDDDAKGIPTWNGNKLSWVA